MPELLFYCYGPDFAVDAFLADSPWCDWAEVFRRGEPAHAPAHEKSGFDLALTDGGPLEEQLAEALAFFDDDRDELQRLAAFPGVTRLELRIGLFWWRDSWGQFHSLPPEFMRQAGELGIAVTLCIYACSENKPEQG